MSCTTRLLCTYMQDTTESDSAVVRTSQIQTLRWKAHYRARLSVGQDITESDSAVVRTSQIRTLRWKAHITESDSTMGRTSQSQALQWAGQHRVRLCNGQDITESGFVVKSTLQNHALVWAGHLGVRRRGTLDTTEFEPKMCRLLVTLEGTIMSKSICNEENFSFKNIITKNVNSAACRIAECLIFFIRIPISKN